MNIIQRDAEILIMNKEICHDYINFQMILTSVFQFYVVTLNN